MRLAVMQPYFLPYIGYFQLMAAVDKFVLLDDVAFINGGWINRNRILVNGRLHWLTIPLAKASQNRLINEIEIIDERSWKQKMLRTVELSYRRSPFGSQILLLFSEMLDQAGGSLSVYLFRQLRQVAEYMGINVEMEVSSTTPAKHGRSGQDRILDICAREKATHYVNLPGGRSLYDSVPFASAGIELLFLKPNLDKLALRHSGHEGPTLSILDILMLNSPETIHGAIDMCQVEGK